MDAISSQLSPAIQTLLSEHRSLTDEYEKLAKEAEEDDDFEPEGAEALNAAIADSTRSLSRELLNDVEAVALVRSAGILEDPGLVSFVKEIHGLRAILFEKLLTTVDEERRRQAYLVDLMSREQRLNADIEKLEDQVEALRDDREAELLKREEIIDQLTVRGITCFCIHLPLSRSLTAVIRTPYLKSAALLQDDLNAVTQQGEVVARRVERDAKRRETVEEQNFVSDRERLEAEIAKVEAQLAETRAHNKESELTLRDRKKRLENDIQYKIGRYDEDMNAKQASALLSPVSLDAERSFFLCCFGFYEKPILTFLLRNPRIKSMK